MIQDFTGGNLELLPKLIELGDFSGPILPGRQSKPESMTF